MTSSKASNADSLVDGLCRARLHEECRNPQCHCLCHDTPDADRLVDLDDDSRDR